MNSLKLKDNITLLVQANDLDFQTYLNTDLGKIMNDAILEESVYEGRSKREFHQDVLEYKNILNLSWKLFYTKIKILLYEFTHLSRTKILEKMLRQHDYIAMKLYIVLFGKP